MEDSGMAPGFSSTVYFLSRCRTPIVKIAKKTEPAFDTNSRDSILSSSYSLTFLPWNKNKEKNTTLFSFVCFGSSPAFPAC